MKKTLLECSWGFCDGIAVLRDASCACLEVVDILEVHGFHEAAFGSSVAVEREPPGCCV